MTRSPVLDARLRRTIARAAALACAGLALGTYGLIGSLAGVPEVHHLLAMLRRKREA